MEPIKVLLVEDNPADADLTCETLEAGKIKLEVFVVVDGVEAIDFLQNRGKFADAERPEIILLDLNLPRRDGRSVLGEIKNDPELKAIPVVILTSSDAETDILKSYDLGANCYVTKPVDLSQFQKIVQSLEDFWFTIVRLPDVDGAARDGGELYARG